MKRVRFTRKARADLRAIKEHVHNENPRAARRLIEGMQGRAARLGDMPHIGRSRADLRPGVRSVAYGSYVIFYTVEPDIVWIQRIIHGARDIDAVFDDDA